MLPRRAGAVPCEPDPIWNLRQAGGFLSGFPRACGCGSFLGFLLFHHFSYLELATLPYLWQENHTKTLAPPRGLQLAPKDPRGSSVRFAFGFLVRSGRGPRPGFFFLPCLAAAPQRVGWEGRKLWE
jgi:hypothetical protein